MLNLTIDVADLTAIKARTQAALRGEPQGCAYHFLSEAELLTTLNADRWAILKALTGAGALGVGELAQRLGRDLPGTQADAALLVRCGLIDRQADGRLCFPYDAVDLHLSHRAAA